MLSEPIEAPAETSPAELLADYEAALAEVVADLGADRVADATGLDRAVVDAMAAGDAADVDLRDVAAVLALREGSADAATILTEVRDHLLLSMTGAMLTVDRVAADVDGDLDPKEIQAMVEGRHPMTLDEYARIHHFVAEAR